MTTYVIGDVQGCYQPLLCLLEKIRFNPEKDKLWFAGDLVNRGPDSLNTLRLIKQIASKVVLGNHDLHLLACYYRSLQTDSVGPLRKKDTFIDILEAEDCEELMNWLRCQPLMVWSKKKQLAMTHAGIPHIWSVKQAYKLSKEVNKVLRGKAPEQFFEVMYGNSPDSWDEALKDFERLRVITNYLTRMRFVTDDGQLDFDVKESADSAPPGFRPWYRYARRDPENALVLGHWAALGGKTGVSNIFATDTGCVWGGSLTALNIRTKETISCECPR